MLPLAASNRYRTCCPFVTRTEPGTAVGEGVQPTVAVAVGVLVMVAAGDAVAVEVGVLVAAGEAVAVAVGLDLEVGADVGVLVVVGKAVAVAVAGGMGVLVETTVDVGVGGVGVGSQLLDASGCAPAW